MKKLLSIGFLLIAFCSLGQVQYGTDVAVIGAATQTATVNNILTASSGTAATDILPYRSVTVQVTSTGTAGTFIFEGSNDNTNFQTIPVYNQNVVTGTPIIAAITATASQFIYIFPRTARYVRLRIASTITGGSIQAFPTYSQVSFAPPTFNVSQNTPGNLNVNVGTLSNTTQLTGGTGALNITKAEDNPSANGDALSAIAGIRNDALASNVSATGDYGAFIQDLYGSIIVKQQQLHKRTYSCSFVVTPATAATDIFQIIGSSTTTVEITRIFIGGTQTTAGVSNFYLIKRSAANTAGTSSAAAFISHNSVDASATAVGAIYTANPTTGTPVGTVMIAPVPIGSITGNNVQYDVPFAINSKPIILNGTSQALAINLNGATITGGSINVTLQITEY